MTSAADTATAPDEDVPLPRESRARTIAGFAVSVIAIAGCVWWASRQDSPRFPEGVGNWVLLVVAAGVYGAATIIRGARWDAILRYLHVFHARVDAYALTAVGYMGNTVLPARGGEVLRIFLLAERSHARRREVLGSIITERLLDVAALGGLFVVLTVSGAAEAPGGDATMYGAIGALILGVGAAFAYLRLRVAGKFESFADRVRPITRASRQLLTVRGAQLLLVTMCVWALEGAIMWLAAQAIDVPLGIGEGLVVVVLASLSALIPAGPGYVGTYDAAALFALHQVDVRGGAAVSTILLFRFVVFVPITVAGLVLMIGRYGGLRGALSRERAAEAPA
ncbi:MAG TPA: lysylphosphatidylglycerol synthase transmembrane domain-containing protein [Solirubrobacteraceae bacterium]